MALPKLTDEQRKEALAKAAEARKARAELKAALKRGETDLKDVLEKAETDEIIGKTKVLHSSRLCRRLARSRLRKSWRIWRLLRPAVCAAWVSVSVVLSSSVSATANSHNHG